MFRDSAQSIRALEDKFSGKLSILEIKIQELETKRVNTNNECNKTNDEDKIIETKTTGLQPEYIVGNTSHIKEIKCDVCSKDFKSKATILNHDKKFHIVKGTKIYKCDNCNEKMEDKMKLISHIIKEHIVCTMCMKIFLNTTSLSFHMNAVHDKQNKKHQIEKEPSLRIIKAQRSH